MKHWTALALVAFAGVAQAGTGLVNGILDAGDGSVDAAYEMGTLTSDPTTLLVITRGGVNGTFEEYANFSIAGTSEVSGSANSYALTFGALNPQEIVNLSIDVWDNTHPNGGNLYATFAGNNVTTLLGTLAAGQYHIDINGNFSENSNMGSYSVALAAVPAVPEPQTYALMLAGLGAMAFMARRRRENQQS